MNLDSLTAALSHIGNIVQTLAKKNIQYDSCYCQEIVEIIHTFGGEAERHLFRVVVGHLEWGSSVNCVEGRNSTPTTATSASTTPTTSSGSLETQGLCRDCLC